MRAGSLGKEAAVILGFENERRIRDLTISPAFDIEPFRHKSLSPSVKLRRYFNFSLEHDMVFSGHIDLSQAQAQYK